MSTYFLLNPFELPYNFYRIDVILTECNLSLHEITSVIQEFERIQKKICRHKMSIMFNEICINEEMLPIYIYYNINMFICIKLGTCLSLSHFAKGRTQTHTCTHTKHATDVYTYARICDPYKKKNLKARFNIYIYIYIYISTNNFFYYIVGQLMCLSRIYTQIIQKYRLIYCSYT